MTTVLERIQICQDVRKFTAEQMANIFRQYNEPSEIDFTNSLEQAISKNSNLYATGWYDPPPGGWAALFAQAAKPQRLAYGNLRKPEFWPKPNYKFGQDCLGMVYGSPVHRNTATIGDFGLTVYNGTNKDIQEHLAKSLSVIEQTADFAEIGMEFRELHSYGQKLQQSNSLSSSKTVTVTDPVGTNIGHTIPFSYEEASKQEEKIIASGNINQVKTLISQKRVHINKAEKFTVKENIAFTVEMSLEHKKRPELPNAYFHLIVTFRSGKKTISANFKDIFEILEMDKFIISRY